MKRKTLLSVGLVAIFMLAACVPKATPPTATPDSGVSEALALPTAAESEAPTALPATEDVAPTEVPAEVEPTADTMAVPTSRGAQLVATDPTTVNLASGQPQLLEFFAFW